MQFAKVREEQGHLAEAAVEYERAGDAASSVRLLLETGNVNKAFGVSRRSGSATAAALIVKHCVGQSNWAGAVEFSIIAGDYNSAWQVQHPSVNSHHNAVRFPKHGPCTNKSCDRKSYYCMVTCVSTPARTHVLAAMQVAQTHGEMDTYATSLGSIAPVEQHAQVAVCFQNVKEHFKAAEQFELAGNQLSAVSQYMAHAKKVLSC